MHRNLKIIAFLSVFTGVSFFFLAFGEPELVEGMNWITLQPGETAYGFPEQPHTNKLDHMLVISEAPITCEQYAKFLKATGRAAPHYAAPFHELADQFTWRDLAPPRGYDNWPVAFVSKADCVAYCDWLSKKTGRSYRLPTKEELSYCQTGASGKSCTWVEEGSISCAWWGVGPVGRTNQIRSKLGLQCFPMALLEWTSGDWVESQSGSSATDGQTHVYGMQGPGQVLGVFGFRIVAEPSK